MTKQLVSSDPPDAASSTTIALGKFAFEALGGGDDPPENVSRRLVRAIHTYLTDGGTNQTAWAYPALLQERERNETIEMDLLVEDSLWRSLEAEARRRAVSVPQLVTHAALYYAAEQDRGRIAQRILDDIAAKESTARDDSGHI